jgi:transposase-like protein
MEERRMQAADLFRRGVIRAEIGRRLGVSHQVVSEWRKAWGKAAELRCAGRDVPGGAPD